jgi:hypothetical protein
VYDQAELDELFGPDGDGAVDELPSGDEMGPDEINETRRQLRDGEAKRVRGKDGRVKIVAVKEFVGRSLKVGKGNDGKALNFVQRKKARLVYYCDRPSPGGLECGGDVIAGVCLRCKLPFTSPPEEEEAESGEGDD